jgi:heat shock protein HtpX
MRPGLLVARNLLKATLLFGGYVAALAALGWWLGGIRLGSVFLFVALLMAATVFWYGPRILLTALGARELTIAEAPPLYTMVERLAGAAGVARPKLYLMADGYPRAFSVGRGAADASIAVSQGLVSVMAPAELEGVLAHELAHARHRDVTIQTPVALVAVWLIEASRMGGFLERALLVVFAPLAASFVHLMLTTKRELAADLAAAITCDSPHGLADALIRLEQAMELVSFSASPATEPLYTVNPFEEDRLSVMFNSHPPLEERVQRLRGLDADWRERLRAA